MLWVLALLGVVDGSKKVCVPGGPAPHEDGVGACPAGQHLQRQISYGAYFGLLVAFYWGLQVTKNISHTVTVGAVGSWWFRPDDGNAVGGSLHRACTTSLGSICFGSLLVAVLRALEQLA